jgi:hypothetical protein
MEDRLLKRTRTYHPGRILLQSEGVHHCTVHNVTDRGICLELTFEAEQLPDRFEFSLDNFKNVYVCKTIWREDYVAGVAFERSPSAPPAGGRAKLRFVK